MKTFTDRMLDGYMECALWSTPNYIVEGEEPETFDADGYDVTDIADETKEKMREDVVAFFDAHHDQFGEVDAERCGHDFWLSRNGHGAGFFDGDYGEHCQTLQNAARVYGSVDLYFGKDNKIHQQ